VTITGSSRSSCVSSRRRSAASSRRSNRGNGPHDSSDVIRRSGRAVEARVTWTCSSSTRPARSRSQPPGGRRSNRARPQRDRPRRRRQLSSLADETPEGRSIVILAKEKFNIRERNIGSSAQCSFRFTADANERRRHRRAELPEGRVGRDQQVRRRSRRRVSSGVQRRSTGRQEGRHAARRPPSAATVLGVVELKDIVKGGIKERSPSSGGWASRR